MEEGFWETSMGAVRKRCMCAAGAERKDTVAAHIGGEREPMDRHSGEWERDRWQGCLWEWGRETWRMYTAGGEQARETCSRCQQQGGEMFGAGRRLLGGKQKEATAKLITDKILS